MPKLRKNKIVSVNKTLRVKVSPLGKQKEGRAGVG